ncbi:MAG: DUF1223 domain-containing protein [Phenylobacterium sp.]
MRGALFACLLMLSPAVASAAPRSLVVIELYTAQGCGSCTGAGAAMEALAARPDVLPLTFNVDYWDYLGWTDTLARPEFVVRQKTYVSRFKLEDPYTPQAVVGGRGEAGALEAETLETLITKAVQAPAGPRITVSADSASVASGTAPKGGAEVWMVRYDPRPRSVQVRRGDNRGQTVVAINAVRELRRLGSWRGRTLTWRLPAATESGLATVVIVQSPKGGRILSATKIPPSRK